ncbi:MAG: DNA-3-methyladenine glycosylase [Bacteroidota bacterium]
MLKIPKPPIFSFQECLWFLNRNYDDCLYEITKDSAIKLVRLDDEITLFEVKEEGDFLVVEVLNGATPKEEKLVDYVKEWFDTTPNLAPFYKLLEKDADLAYMTKDYYGLRLIGIPSLFESLCWSIIGQQINLSFAYKTKRALVEKYSHKEVYQGENYYLFPEPEVLAELTPQVLREIQFSRQKSEYIVGIAQLFADNRISKADILALESEEKIQKELIKIRGVGVWTANYAMMKCLKCPNALTYGDVGLYNALHTIKGFPKRPSKEQLDDFFDPFEGYKAYLNLYLWRSLAVPNYAPKI